MANKTKGYKDARSIEGMNSVTFYPEAPVFGKNDIDEVPEEHRQRCVLVSWPIGGPERVFTESEVMAYERDLIWAMSDPGRFTERHREERVIGEPFEETVPQWVSRARAIVRAKHGLSNPA
jgi:hypothetical protein